MILPEKTQEFSNKTEFCCLFCKRLLYIFTLVQFVCWTGRKF